MSFVTLSPSQVAAKAPVDEQLLQQIKDNEDYLYANLLTAGNFDFQFKLNGYLRTLGSRAKLRFDGALVGKDQTFSACKAYLEEPGDGGTLEVDVRAYTKPDTLITAITRQFSSSINSIARVGSSINTQSVTRATAQISTQSITAWKSALNVSSIVPLPGGFVRVNFSTQPDAGHEIGDSVLMASCTDPLNNGTFVIVKKNIDNGNNLVFANAAAVAQAGATGTGTLLAWSYNQTNPVSSQFAAGESALFAAHSTGGNNGTLPIYAINQSGNNIIVKNASGATQGGAAGTVDTNRWIFAFSSSAPSDYVVGEKALMASHTAGGNDGSFTITNVNTGGNNVIVYNTAGVVQGGAAGTVNTKRWAYFFSVDPSSQVTAGDSVVGASTSSAANSGTFVVKQVNRSTSDNIIIYNDSGVAQGGSAGTLASVLMLVKFAADQSATITTASKITLFGTSRDANDNTFQVTEVNRGGGANYNAVVSSSTMVEQVGACGRVVLESKSIFDTTPSFVIAPSTNAFYQTHGRVSSNAVFNATRKTIAAGTLIMPDVLSIPSGNCKNLVVQLL